jgi:hypothetical protein
VAAASVTNEEGTANLRRSNRVYRTYRTPICAIARAWQTDSPQIETVPARPEFDSISRVMQS